MEQVLDVFNVPEMMAGAKQGQQLIPGPRTALAVEGKPLERIFPGGAGGGLDQNLIFLLQIPVGRVIQLLHDRRDLAALNDVVFPKLAVAAAQASAVEKGA